MVVVVHFGLECKFQLELSIFPHSHVRFLSMPFDRKNGELYTNKSTSIELKTVSDDVNLCLEYTPFKNMDNRA